VDLFNHIRKKLLIFVHFKGFNISQKPRVIAICVVLDHTTVIFQKEKGVGYIQKSLVCTTPINVDRNKNVITIKKYAKKNNKLFKLVI
jgi:hypothetical protein